MLPPIPCWYLSYPHLFHLLFFLLEVTIRPIVVRVVNGPHVVVGTPVEQFLVHSLCFLSTGWQYKLSLVLFRNLLLFLGRSVFLPIVLLGLVLGATSVFTHWFSEVEVQVLKTLDLSR